MTYGSSGVCEKQKPDQPAHPRSLISALFFAFWKVIYPNWLHANFQLSS